VCALWPATHSSATAPGASPASSARRATTTAHQTRARPTSDARPTSAAASSGTLNKHKMYAMIQESFNQYNFPFSSICPTNSTGLNCEIPNSACATNPCLNQGLCKLAEGGTFQCECQRPWDGKMCEKCKFFFSLSFMYFVGSNLNEIQTKIREIQKTAKSKQLKKKQIFCLDLCNQFFVLFTGFLKVSGKSKPNIKTAKSKK
jgi:hypothetical protein